MAVRMPRFSYTGLTYEKIREACFNFVQSPENGLTDKWTDFNESDPGVALIELLSAIGDELAFAQDMAALEAFLSTARQRRSVVNLVKLIGYRLDPVTTAEGIATFKYVPKNSMSGAATLPDYLEFPVVIPKYTRLATSGPEVVSYVTADSVTIPAGSQQADVRIRQGVLNEEEFPADGRPHQQYVLARTDVAANFGAVEVLVGQGDDLSQYVEWNEAANFLINSPDDNQKRFVVGSNERDQISLTFGDGRFGEIPPDGFTIVVRYLMSVGSNGNVGGGMVNVLLDHLRDVEGVQAPLQVLNSEPCYGGSDRETIEHAKRQAPQELAALHRMVTKYDASALVAGLAGIGKARVWGEQELPHPDIRHFNHMYVTFTAEGIEPEIARPDSWLPTTALKNLIIDFVEDKKIITTEVIFIEPIVAFIDVQLEVFISDTASPDSVKHAIFQKLEAFFDVDNQQFGQDLRYSQLVSALSDTPNVEYLRVKIKRNGAVEIPLAGREPYLESPPDTSQWNFDEHDIVIRRNEFCQLGAVVGPFAQGESNIVSYGRDEDPIKASFGYYPHYQWLNQPVTFNATRSSSPTAPIVQYKWRMGSTGVLLTQNAQGQYLLAAVQPTDGETFTTTESQIIWKYTVRPSSGYAIVVLEVTDAVGGIHAFALPYEIRS